MERGRLDVDHSFFEWACFTSHQSAEKVIKGLALNLGLTGWAHSLIEILRIVSERIEIPEQLKNEAKLLDLYYIPPRYPSGFPSGRPADSFTEKQAGESIDAADHILRFCESHLAR